jgi:HSP90 family molecular chaperone
VRIHRSLDSIITNLDNFATADKSLYDGSNPLNITIRAYKDEDGKGGRLIIADTGIGMTKDELANNLVRISHPYDYEHF